jgi:DNA-binding IclR family transcriptional regulator
VSKESDMGIDAVQVRSVAKALTILDLLARNGREMPLSEICREMGLAKGTIHGLLATLKDFQYVDQDGFEGKYRLGIRLFEVGNIVANSWDVRRVAAPYIEKLVDELEETVHLAVLNEDRVLYIDKRESRRSIRIVSQVGMRLPAHCSGVGKALLANLQPSELGRVVASRGLPSYTKNTITDARRLEEELGRIRQQGYSVDNEEIMEGLRCVAAPIRDHSGGVCAAISVSGPVARLVGDRFAQVVEMVTGTAAEISAGLGFRPSRNGELHGVKGVPVPTA